MAHRLPISQAESGFPMTTEPYSHNHLEAVKSLWKQYAKFVILRPDTKIPAWKGWNRKHPSLRSAIDAYPDLGLIPASLGMSVLDVDYGKPDSLIRRFSPLAKVDTPSGGVHLYYGDMTARRNSIWHYQNQCGGDVRSGTGFVKLYNPVAVAHAVEYLHSQEDTQSFPLLERQGISRREQDTRTHKDTDRPHAINLDAVSIAYYDDLAHVPIGARNQNLFEHLRLWAYQQVIGATWDAWFSSVKQQAFKLNACFPDSLPMWEAQQLAYYVARWTWKRRAQRRVGGKVRAAQVREENDHRDMLIRELRSRGFTYAAIAKHFGMSTSQAYRIASRRE